MESMNFYSVEAHKDLKKRFGSLQLEELLYMERYSAGDLVEVVMPALCMGESAHVGLPNEMFLGGASIRQEHKVNTTH